MHYRKFGNLDWQASVLGFGCMRLPTSDGIPMSPNINEEEAIKMIRYAIDQGVNYIDTAYYYHKGQSEVVAGKALQDGYREKVMLATKSPVLIIRQAEDFDQYLQEQLERLQTEVIDFYLLHGLNRDSWRNKVLKFDLLNKAERYLSEGKIKHLGFSFHDNYESFQEIVAGYDSWEFCQIQYNYMDTENQAGTKGLKYAAAEGLAVVIMEPLLGGRLANPTPDILDIFHGFDKKRTPADWALQWIWNQPETAVVLSGMNTLEQVKENIQSASASGINTLTADELQLIQRVRGKYLENTKITCTDCNYCMPCPNNLEIPKNFRLYNDVFLYNDANPSQRAYSIFLPMHKQAGSCTQCRICEEKCPQGLPISQLMPQVHELLGQK
jgi:predicted aldo/keto reductase-like oxidoreductase